MTRTICFMTEMRGSRAGHLLSENQSSRWYAMSLLVVAGLSCSLDSHCWSHSCTPPGSLSMWKAKPFTRSTTPASNRSKLCVCRFALACVCCFRVSLTFGFPAEDVFMPSSRAG